MNRLTSLQGLGIVAAIAITACAIGPDIEDVLPANSPRGTRVRLELSGGRQSVIEGELLAVREADVLVLTSRGYTSVPYATFSRVRYQDAPGAGQAPNTAGRWEQIRPFARYPAGLNADVLQRLLRSNEQDELVVIRE